MPKRKPSARTRAPSKRLAAQKSALGNGDPTEEKNDAGSRSVKDEPTSLQNPAATLATGTTLVKSEVDAGQKDQIRAHDAISVKSEIGAGQHQKRRALTSADGPSVKSEIDAGQEQNQLAIFPAGGTSVKSEFDPEEFVKISDSTEHDTVVVAANPAMPPYAPNPMPQAIVASSSSYKIGSIATMLVRECQAFPWHQPWAAEEPVVWDDTIYSEQRLKELVAVRERNRAIIDAEMRRLSNLQNDIRRKQRRLEKQDPAFAKTLQTDQKMLQCNPGATAQDLSKQEPNVSVKAEAQTNIKMEPQKHIKLEARECVKVEAQGNAQKGVSEDTREASKVETQEDTKEEPEGHTLEARSDTGTDNKKKTKNPWSPHFHFVDGRSRTMCNTILGFEVQAAANAVYSVTNAAEPLDPLLAKVMIYFGAENADLQLTPFHFSLLDLARTQERVKHSRVLSLLAAERIISFCPHLLDGDILLRITTQTTLDDREVRRILGCNGSLPPHAWLGSRRVRSMGALMYNRQRNTSQFSTASQWYTTNLKNYNAYKDFFRFRARFPERFMPKAIDGDVSANTDGTKLVPTVTKYNQMETVQSGVVIYRPYVKRMHSKGMHHRSIKRSASDEDLEALRKRIKVEEQE